MTDPGSFQFANPGSASAPLTSTPLPGLVDQQAQSSSDVPIVDEVLSEGVVDLTLQENLEQVPAPSLEVEIETETSPST